MTVLSQEATRAAVDAFNEAFSRHDLDGVMAAMTADCVFETTAPPDGVRHEGRRDVREAFGEFFTSSPGAAFDAEGCFVIDERAVVRWTYRWGGDDGGGHVRGIDLFLVREGKVAEKCSYVKG